MRRTYAILCLLASSVGCLAQDSLRPLPTPTPSVDERIRIQTELVVLTITVQDEAGRYVAGKKRSDFLVFDNDRPVEIGFFSDTDEPASVLFLFDVSGSMSVEKLRKSRTALDRFLMTSHPSDEYFSIAFNDRVEVLDKGLRDGQAVVDKLSRLKASGNTALYDGLSLGIRTLARSAYRKKAVIIISDGQDNRSRDSFRDVKSLLKETDILIYAVGIGTPTAGKLGYLGQANLESLASLTGGRAFFPKNEIEMDEAFEKIGVELRHQYSIGFTPPDIADNKWHKLKVKLPKSPSGGKLALRTRKGYMAVRETKQSGR